MKRGQGGGLPDRLWVSVTAKHAVVGRDGGRALSVGIAVSGRDVVSVI